MAEAAATEMCHCGQPLHYTNPAIELLMRALVAKHGPTMLVSVDGRTWLVQRHYVALHGLKAWELPRLGFPEVAGL